QQRWVLLAAARRTAGAADVVALAQGESPHLAKRDVHVLPAGQVATRAQEAVALVAQVEEALHGHRLALELLLALTLVLELAVAPVTVASAPAAAAPVPGLGHAAVRLLVPATALALLVLRLRPLTLRL